MVNKQQYVFYRVILVLTTLWGSTAQDLKTPWLVHTNLNTINGLEMNTSSWNNYTIISGLTGAISVDYHFTQGYLYWTDQLTDRITRASLSNREDKEDLVTYSLDRADGMAVDWIYNHIYWIDATHKHVKVANLDGSLRKTLIDTDLVTPRAIVVHPNEGWLFFTDVSKPRIIRCGLDGSNRQTIISSETTDISEPNGLSIDFSSNRLYWIDNVYKQIQSSNLNGTEIRRLTTSSDYMPWAWGLIVFEDKIYWTSFTNNTIYRVDKATGLHFEVVKTELSIPIGIKIYSQENQPTGENKCGQTNGGCEQLCLPSPQSTIQCACADGFQLENDRKRCFDIGSRNWLTFANSKTIERLDVDTSVTETIATGSMRAVALDIHYSKGLVYWSGAGDNKKIMRSSVTKDSVSGVVEDVVTEAIDRPDGLAIDWIYDLLYWTDSRYDHIQVSRLDGTDRRTIVKDDSLDEPRAIVVDPIRGWLFFTDWGRHPRIERCRMDGTDRSTIVDHDIKWPNGLSIDNAGERLYWIDGNLTQIKSTNYDGSGTHTILKSPLEMPQPFDLVVFDSYVYWTNWRHKSIYRINKNSGKDLKLIASYVHNPMGIQMFGAGAQVNGNNWCGDDNRMCSHICFPLPAYESTKTGCMCPDFFIMEADNKTCKEIERPSDIMINVTSSSVMAITWTLPVTSSDFIKQTEVKLYDGNNDLVYNRVVNYPDTSLIITSVQMTSCDMYALKLRCKYNKVGWSQYQEEKFWATDNLIYVEEGKSVNISWTNKVNLSSYNVAFNQLSNQTDDLIYVEGILQKSTAKYTSFRKIGFHIQFTLTQVNKSDVGLYKSISTSNSPSIDGCAILVMREKPQKPNMTFDQYPFVNSRTIFRCVSHVQRWPIFVPYSLQYSWIGNGDVRNILTIYPVSKLDKGKNISCRATDDLGKISDSSEVITLDPYYGPDNVTLSISGNQVSVTQGRQLGPITCSAVCYMECGYIWKRLKNGVYSIVMVGQNFTIYSTSMDDGGSYICYVTHKNDTSRIGTVTMEISVQNKEPEKSTPSTVASTTSTMSNPPSRIVNNGLKTKDIIAYSAVSGSVIVIGIVAGLCIFYCLRRRRQNPPPCNRENTSDQHSSRLSEIYATINDEIELASHMERENPSDTYLRCVNTSTYETLRSPDANPKSKYSDFNARRDCMQIPPGNHELKDHNNIDFKSDRSDVMTYLTATSHPPKSCVVDDDDHYLSVIELSSKA